MHMDAELWGEIHIVTVGNAKKIGKTTSFWHVIDYKKYIYM